MKVYIVYLQLTYEPGEIFEVFDTYEKAEKCLEEQNNPYLVIYEWEVK